MTTRNHRGVSLPGCVATATLLVCLGLSGCDFDVVNPGPLQDSATDDPGAWLALVNGIERALADGFEDFAESGDARARQIQPAGDTNLNHEYEIGSAGSPGSPVDIGDQEAGFGELQQARWVGEQAIERVEAVLGSAASSNELLAQMYLWTGYANRILGEYMCHAVFNGGPPEDYKTHLTRAIGQFTSAANIAMAGSDVQMAAYGGRASTHLHLQNYAEAEADAQRIPMGFEWGVHYYSENSPSWYWVTQISGAAVRGITTWMTLFDEYYLDTGDPRAAWGFDPTYPTGETPRPLTWGDVPFQYPLKFFLPRTPAAYTDFDSRDGTAMRNLTIPVTSYREMQLIIAEVGLELRSDWQTARDIINSRRAELITENTSVHGGSHEGGTPLEPFPITDLESAWKWLKRERAIEMWMEGRRIGDLRRWREQGTPGELHHLELIPEEVAQRHGVSREQDVCIPIPQREIETNNSIANNFRG